MNELDPFSLTFLSKIPGMGGILKSSPEDFIVEEIDENGLIFELNATFSKTDTSGKFVHFIMQKRDWSTSSAISEIANRLHCSHMRFSAAGTKDKQALTTQRVSALGFSKDQILSLNIKDLKILGAWTAHDKVRMGELLGNRFTIKVTNMPSNSSASIKQIYENLGGVFPNYFGEQRFGSTRKNTHLIGLELLRGDFESAVLSFLCNSEGENNLESILARRQLLETGNYFEALKAFPKHLRLERMVIDHLSREPSGYANALKKLPRPTLLMFVHALQSYIFNLLLSERIAESGSMLELESGEYYCTNKSGFPDLLRADSEGFHVGKIIGYETSLNEREKSVLEKLSIEKAQFRLPNLAELASKGTHRILFAPLNDFYFSPESYTFRFSLPSGSYATMAMREFIDTNKD